MQPQIGFPLFLVSTVLLLGLVLATGLTGRRRPHFLFVSLTLLFLVVTILFAEALGKTLDLEGTGRAYPIHLRNAQLAVGAFGLTLVTGLIHLFTTRGKRIHFWCAMLATGLMVLAACTGTVMWMLAEPRSP